MNRLIWSVAQHGTSLLARAETLPLQFVHLGEAVASRTQGALDTALPGKAPAALGRGPAWLAATTAG